MFTLLCAALAAAATDGPIKVTTWSASSTADATAERAYEPKNLGDGKQSNAWVEGESGGGLGSWVLAEFAEAQTVAMVTVWAGNWYNTEYWGHYNRPKTLLLEFADGSTEELTLTDEQKAQQFKLKAPKSTTSVKFRLKAIYSGKGVDTAISEVKFYGSTAALPTAGASSATPDDADGNYQAQNLVDGISDSMWCEGNKKSDGTGEWVEVRLGRSATLTGLKVRNGAGFSADLYKQVNRAATVTASFGDGGSETLSVKDVPFEQTVSFGSAHTTDRVKLSFTDAKKGTDYDDLCISELTPVP